MDWDAKTINTYDKSAKSLAEYFKGIGPRIEDIKLGLRLANAGQEARIVEIGCGDGRDASEIIKLVEWYEGFDPSKGLISIARKELPGTSFLIADALSYSYPKNIDVIYAFASLLHINKSNLKVVLRQIEKSLRSGGVILISLKERDKYTEEVKKDEYGERMFYYYTPEIINKISSKLLSPIYLDRQIIGKTGWFTIILRRV